MDQDTSSLQTIRDFIRWGISEFNRAGLFYGHGTDNALDEAAYLVLHSLHLPMDLPKDYLNSALTHSEKTMLLKKLERRVKDRIPVAYLTGEAWFAGLLFHVTQDVLVPRSPIAELIEAHFEPWVDEAEVHRILDLCTGSGCIGIAAAMYFPEADVDLVDISEKALEVSRINVQRHELEQQVRVLKSDGFNELGSEKYDIIVSNPPYVSTEELQSLPDEYHREPVLGLAGGHDGLDLVVRILAEAADHLNPKGILVVEVGNSSTALAERFPEVPFLWMEFERGGDGVFMLTEEQAQQYQSVFADDMRLI